MQAMRREWINESKPQDKSEESLRQIEEMATQEQKSPKPQGCLSNSSTNAVDDDDLYSATPRKPKNGTDLASRDKTRESLFLSENEAASQASEDSLDDLIAENNLNLLSRDIHNESVLEPEGRSQRLEADFEDEMEAMAGMDDLW